MELIIEILYRLTFFSGMTFLYFVMVSFIIVPIGIMFVSMTDNISEWEAMKKFFKEVFVDMLVTMVKFSLIAGIGVTILIYLRQLY